MSPVKDNDLILLGVIVLSLCLLDTVGLRDGHAWGDDFSQYIAQARSIADGTVRETLEVSRFRYDNSDTKLIGPVLYPWGFPLLLSGVYSLCGLDMAAMKVFTVMFFLGSLAVVFLLFRDRLSTVQGFLAVLALGLNPVFFEAKDDVLSDFPFMFFTLLTLLLVQRVLVDRRPVVDLAVDHAIIGVCMLFAYAVRANGVVLLPLLALVQLVEAGKVFRTGTSPSLAALVCLLPYAVFVALLFCLDVLLPSSSSYADQLQDMGVGTALRNVWLYGIMPVEFFTRSMGPVTAVLGKLLYLVSVPAVCLGMVRTWREHYLYAAFTGLFMALLILWPGIQGLRYIFPVMPFYLFFLFHGLNEAAAYLATHIHARPSLPVPAAAYGAVCAALFGLTVSGQAFHALANPGEVMEGPYAPDSAALFHFISEHTRPRDVVIFGKPRALWLYTGRKAIRLTRLEDIMVSRAKYVACRKNDPVDAVLKGRAWVARRVYSNTSFNLYARMRLTPVSLPAEGGEPAGPGNGTAGNREASKKKAQEKGGRRWDGPVRTIIL